MSWQPIETAPKDAARLLLFIPSNGESWSQNLFVCGYWCADQYAKKPRPYWTNDRERVFGTRHTRSNQPTHWTLPEPPIASGASEGSQT